MSPRWRVLPLLPYSRRDVPVRTLSTDAVNHPQALDQLESLPSLEGAKAQVKNVVAESKDAARRVLPSLEWQSRNAESGA